MILRWGPLSDVGSLRRAASRPSGDAAASGRPQAEAADAMWAPPVNTYEDNEGYTLFCDLPGIAQDEVKLNLNAETLSVSGTRKLDHETRREIYTGIECAFGTFARSFTLPAIVDTDKIQATMKNGVLKIHLPKREESKPRQIEIKIR